MRSPSHGLSPGCTRAEDGDDDLHDIVDEVGNDDEALEAGDGVGTFREETHWVDDGTDEECHHLFEVQIVVALAESHEILAISPSWP